MNEELGFDTPVTLKNLVDIIKNTNNLVKYNAKVLLIKEFKNLIDKFPNIEAFRWDQYAPSFNDGDPCVFYVRPETFNVKFKDQNEFYDSSEDNSSEHLKEYGKIYEHFIKIYDDQDKIFEIAFGDNSTITVTRDDINIDFCENY